MRLNRLSSAVSLILGLATLGFWPLIISCGTEAGDARIASFPRKVDYVTNLPSKENFWLFILAGQSNMAGRGLVEGQDTIPSSRILTLNREGRWVLAKEPLHYYEPQRTGLDCGLAFGRDLLRTLPDSVFIGLVPCAVGGSSVEQWLGDSLHRDVKLFSNFEMNAKKALTAGIVKGLLWHQGEANANAKQFEKYEDQLRALFSRFRATLQNDRLPIAVGELGSFLREENYGRYPDSVNRTLRAISALDSNMAVIRTGDLVHQGDTVHFNSASQRLMGQRFAEALGKMLLLTRSR